jgi:hypothetical protein
MMYINYSRKKEPFTKEFSLYMMSVIILFNFKLQVIDSIMHLPYSTFSSSILVHVGKIK